MRIKHIFFVKNKNLNLKTEVNLDLGLERRLEIRLKVFNINMTLDYFVNNVKITENLISTIKESKKCVKVVFIKKQL